MGYHAGHLRIPREGLLDRGADTLRGERHAVGKAQQGGDVQMLLPLESLAGTEGGNAK